MNLNSKKFLSKFSKKSRLLTKTTHILVLVPIDAPCSGTIFVYELEFFSSNSLGGAFFDQGDPKV